MIDCSTWMIKRSNECHGYGGIYGLAISSDDNLVLSGGYDGLAVITPLDQPINGLMDNEVAY